MPFKKQAVLGTNNAQPDPNTQVLLAGIDQCALLKPILLFKNKCKWEEINAHTFFLKSR